MDEPITERTYDVTIEADVLAAQTPTGNDTTRINYRVHAINAMIAGDEAMRYAREQNICRPRVVSIVEVE